MILSKFLQFEAKQPIFTNHNSFTPYRIKQNTAKSRYILCTNPTTPMSKEIFFEKAADWITKKSDGQFKANMEGYENPKSFKNKQTGEIVQPDFTFNTSSGAKSFTEIALKSDTPQKLVTRWKLLSLIATMKRGKLHLLAPKGHKMFTRNLVDDYNIQAVVHSL